MIGCILVGEIEQKTNMRLKDVDDFESFFNAIGNGRYDSDYVSFTGWLFELYTLEFNTVMRCQNGRGTDFKPDIVEYKGNNCYIPTSSNDFRKCANYFTNKHYTKESIPFTRTEQRRYNVMTSARMQPLCRIYNISIGYLTVKKCGLQTLQKNIQHCSNIKIISVYFENLKELVLKKQ